MWVTTVIKKFLILGPDGRKKEPGIGKDRADLIMSGSAIMQTLLRIWPSRSMKVADRGLREGILYSLMVADNHFQYSYEKKILIKKKMIKKSVLQ